MAVLPEKRPPANPVATGLILLLAAGWLAAFFVNFTYTYKYIIGRPQNEGNGDFKQYLASSRRLMQDRDNLYCSYIKNPDTQSSVSLICATYPPTFYFLMIPFASLPDSAARSLWFLLKLVAVVILSFLLAEIALKGQKRGPPVIWGTVVFCLLFGASAFFYEEITFGQINIMLLLGICLSLRLLKSDRQWAGGALLGFIFCIKLITLPVIIYLAFSRRFRALAGAAVAVSVVVLLTLFFFGQGVFTDYFKASPHTMSMWLNNQNQSVAALMKAYDTSRGGVTQRISQWFYVYGILLSLLCPTLAALSRKAPLEEVFSFLLLSVFFISPIVWHAHHVWLMLPLALYLGGLACYFKDGIFRIPCFLSAFLILIMAFLDGTGGRGEMGKAGQLFVTGRFPLLITFILWIYGVFRLFTENGSDISPSADPGGIKPLQENI